MPPNDPVPAPSLRPERPDPARDRWVDQCLGRMDLEQKVGQTMVFGLCGPVISPDVVDLIRRRHLGGLRISLGFRIINLSNDVKPGSEPAPEILRSLRHPAGANKDFAYARPPIVCRADEYAEVLNTLRRLSLERPGGVPLHFTIDQEGSGSDDLLAGQRLFPHPMGLAASGDPSLAYRAGLAIGRQARAIGANMIHSPLIDVNTNPLNPEVGTRSYGDTADTVIRFARESLRGLAEAGLVATGKHFPGRGESAADAHWGLPTVHADARCLRDVHLAPYEALIADGLPAVMLAHCVYPSLGFGDLPATVNRALITELLRGELGFRGVITTDNMMMGGILLKYPMPEAIILALEAGCDLILNRDESPLRHEILDQVIAAYRTHRLSEAELDGKVARILRMRWDMGLAEGGGLVDPAEALRLTRDPAVRAAATEAAEKSVLLLRDRAGLLPLARNLRILLVEQVFPTQASQNSLYSHPGLLWEEMLRWGADVRHIEIENVPTEKDRARLRRRLAAEGDIDLIVSTNYYYHKAASSISDLVRELMATGKPVVVVANTPYAFAAPDDFGTVVTCFNPGGRENLAAVADLLFGALQPTATLPVKP